MCLKLNELGKWEEMRLERHVGGQVMLDPSSHVKRYHCRGAMTTIQREKKMDFSVSAETIGLSN